MSAHKIKTKKLPLSMEDICAKMEKLRNSEFSRLQDQTYMDHAGSALYTTSHLRRYHDELERNLFGNPHSGNESSERMNDIVSQTRSKVLQLFNVTSEEYDVVFTSGATEALRLVGSYFDWKEDSIFAYFEDNHTSVVGIRELAAAKNASSYCLRFNKDGKITDLNSYCLKLVKATANVSYDKSLQKEECSPSLFAFPAMSNFSGVKYPLQWIDQIQNDNFLKNKLGATCSKLYVLCDAASYASCSTLDLKQHPADFVTISFYKIFGFPTGLGALLVKKSSENILCNKSYFGGGAVSGWLAAKDYFIPKPSLHDRMEDGSISFLSILALKLGFDTFNHLGIDISSIQIHTFALWQILFQGTSELQHGNGRPVVKIYGHHNFSKIDVTEQGPILAFNILRPDGTYVGYNHVLELSNSNNIHLRVGCFCNMGACSFLLNTSDDVLLQSYKDGHVCGDRVDLINGQPIGALRVSLGIASTLSDVSKFIKFLSNCFVEEIVKENGEYNGVSNDVKCARDIVLEKIIVYPVKSCQGMEVEQWQINETGLLFDRMWMIVNEHNVSTTLKKNPKLVLIRPGIDLYKNILTLRSEQMDDCEIPFIYSADARQTNSTLSSQQCLTKVCGDKITGIDCGDRVSNWLTKILGKRYRMIQKHFEGQRLMRPRFQSSNGDKQCSISLVNEAQFLLINKTSVEYLCQSICNGTQNSIAHKDIDNMLMRFRANFIISGAPLFSEDAWKEILITAKTESDEIFDDMQFSVCGLCNRCSMICIDPNNGQKLDEPLKSLSRLTLPGNKHRKTTFGVYLRCNSLPSFFIKSKSKISVLNDSVQLNDST